MTRTSPISSTGAFGWSNKVAEANGWPPKTCLPRYWRRPGRAPMPYRKKRIQPRAPGRARNRSERRAAATGVYRFTPLLRNPATKALEARPETVLEGEIDDYL